MAKQLNVNLAVKADTKQAQEALNALGKSLHDIQNIKNMPMVADESYKSAANAAKELERNLQSAVNVDTGKLDLNKFSMSLKKSNTSITELAVKLNGAGATGQQAFLNLAKSIALADNSALNLGTKLGGLMTTLKNTARWQISSSILHGFMGAIQGAYGYAQDLNESLNNIRIVTGQSIDQMAKFADEANKAARALSTTTTEYTNASLIYYQQGLSDQEVKERTDVTIKLANVSRQSAEEVSSQMTAVWNNFADGSKSLEYYADVITKLGATTASSSDEIAQGLQKFASVADTVGLSYEKATAALATVVAETRQSADVVGTAFKTMFARFQGLSLGETLEDGVDLNKYSKALAVIGVNILDANGELKKMDLILDETAQKWNQISEAQRVALAETVAGTRQYAQFMAIMNNYDKIQSNQILAENSEGAIQQQADIYAESWEAARDRVRAALEEVYGQLLDDKFFIGLLNFAEKAISAISNVIEGLGGIKGLVALIGTIFMNIYAKEMPRVLSTISQNLMIITGQGEKVKSAMLAEVAAGLELNKNTNINLSQASYSNEMQAKYESTQKAVEMTQKLNAAMRTLSESEIAEYQAKISQTVQEGEYLAELGKELDALEKLNTEQSAATAHSAMASYGEARTTKGFSDDEVSGATYEEAINEQLAEQQRLKTEIRQIQDDIGDGILDESEGLDLIRTRNDEIIASKERVAALETSEKSVLNFLNGSYKTAVSNVRILEDETDKITKRTDNWEVAQEKIKALLAGSAQEQKAGVKLTGDLAKQMQNYASYLQQTLEATNGGTLPKGAAEELEKFKTAITQAQETGNWDEVFAKLRSGGDIFSLLSAQVEAAKGALGDARYEGEQLGITFENNPAVEKMTQDMGQAAVTAHQFKDGLSELGAEMENGLNHATSMSEGLVKIGSAAMQVSMAINGIKRISEIWDNEDLSTGEKVLQTMTSLSMILPIITTLLNGEKIAEYGVAAARILGIKTIGGMTLASYAQAAANKAMEVTGYGALVPLSIFLGIAGGLIFIIVKIVEAFKNWQKSLPEEQLKSLNEATQAAGKAAEEAKNAYEDLKSSIENYDSLVDKINSLVKGTNDFKTAIQEANNAAKELIKTYSNVKYHIDENGMIVIDNAEEVLSNAEKTSATRENENFSLENQKLKKSNEIIQSNIQQKKSNLTADNIGLVGSSYLSNEDYKILQENIEQLKQAKNKNEIVSVMGWGNKELTDSQNLFIKQVLDLSGQNENDQNLIFELEGQLANNLERISSNKALALANNLSNDKNYQEAENKSMLLTIASRFFDQQELNSEENEKIDKYSDKDIISLFAAKNNFNYNEETGEFEDIATGATFNYSVDQIRQILKDTATLEGTLGKINIPEINKAITAAGDNANVLYDVVSGNGLSSLTLGQANDLSSKILKDKDGNITGFHPSLIQDLGFAQGTTTKDIAELFGMDTSSFVTSVTNLLSTAARQFEELGLQGFTKNAGVLTYDQAQRLSNNEGALGEGIASDYGEMLDNLIGQVPEDQKSQILSQLLNLDVSDWDFGRQVENVMTEAGVNIDESYTVLFQKIRKKMEAIPILDKIKQEVEDVADVTKNLEFGKTIKEDDFKKLTEYKTAWQDFFTIQADGTYQFIGSQEDAKNMLLESLEREGDALDKNSEEYEIWSSKVASVATSYSELATFKDKISEEAYQNQLNYLATSSINAATSLEELNRALREAAAAGVEIDYATISQGLINLGEKYDNCSEEVLRYQQALASDSTELVKTTEESLRAAIGIGEMTKSLGLSADSVEEQTKAIISENKELKDNEKIVRKTVILNQSMNKGISNLVDNWTDWKKTLTTVDKKSQDYADTLLKVRDTLAELLGVTDANFIPDGFLDLPGVMENLDKATKGDTQAIALLGTSIAKATAQSWKFSEGMKGLNFNSKTEWDLSADQFNNWRNNVVEGIENLTQEIEQGTLKIGDNITDVLDGTGVSWEDSLNEMAYATGMSVEEMNSMLNELGVQADVTTTTKPMDVSVPWYRTATTDGFDENGQKYTESHVIATGIDKVPGEIEVAQINMGDKAGTPPTFTYAGRASASPSALKGSKSGGSAPKHSAKTSPEEKHRYSRVENNIENLSDQYDRLSKAREHAWGTDKLNIMDSEIDKMEELGKAYEGYLDEVAGTDWNKLHKKIQEGSQITAADILGAGGYLAKDYNSLINGSSLKYVKDTDKEGNQIVDTFNTGTLKDLLGFDVELAANGKVANRDEILLGLNKYYLEQENWWNGLTATEQENSENKARWTRIEELINYFKESLDQYDETIEALHDNSDKLYENTQQLRSLKFDILSEKLNLKVSLNDNELKRLEYAAKILGDTVYKSAEILSTYFDANNSNTKYAALSERGSMYEESYYTYKQMYDAGDRSAEVIEGLITAQEGLYDVTDQLIDLNGVMREYYSDTLSKASEELGKLTSQMEHQVSVLDHLKNILSLLNRNTDYNKLDTLIRGIVGMRRNALSSSRSTYNMFNDQLNEARAHLMTLTGIAAEEYERAVVNPLIEKTREAEEQMYSDAEAYAESIEELYSNTLQKIFKDNENFLTDNLGWDFLSETMSRAQAIQDEYLTTTNKIYETNTLLRKLSQDIDKTDSSVAKNKLKAFSDEIESMKQQEKLSQSDLNIAKARYELLLAEIALEEAQNAKSTVRLQRDSEGNYGYVYTADQDKVNDAEQNYADKKNDLYNLALKQANEYGQKIITLEKERDETLLALAEEYRGASGERLEEYNQKRLTIENQFNSQIETARINYYTNLKWVDKTAATDHSEAWVTSFDTIIEKSNDYENSTKKVLLEVESAMKEYDEQAKEISDDVTLGLNNIEEKTNDLVLANEALNDILEKHLIGTLQGELEEIGNTTAAWANQREEIDKVIKRYQTLNAEIQKMQEDSAIKYDKEKDYSQEIIDYVAAHQGEDLSNDTYIKYLAQMRNAKIDKEHMTKDQYITGTLDFIKQLIPNFVGFDTGGYTGEWEGGLGKLALLHSKELILNTEDTENFLAAIDIIRQITSAIDLRAASQALSPGINSPTYTGGEQILEQQVTIHAEFPNAVDHSEIEQAFDTLVNRATQYANRK